VLSNRLEYDAKKVKIAALTRTTGKPDARPGVTEELRVGEHDVVEAGTGLTPLRRVHLRRPPRPCRLTPPIRPPVRRTPGRAPI
jgi:hypothetical protein